MRPNECVLVCVCVCTHEQVIEVGMIGRAALATNRSQVFLHTQRGAGWGDTSEV